MKNFKAVKVIIIFFLILVGLIALSIVSSPPEKDKEVVMTYRDYLVSTFISELPEINKRLPHKIDDKTILLSIDFSNGIIISQYQLYNSFDITALKDLELEIIPVLKKNICLDEIKRNLIDVNINFLEKYLNPTGFSIFEFTVSKPDCQSFAPE